MNPAQLLTIAGLSLVFPAGTGGATPERLAFVVPMSPESDPQDLALLAALPAASVSNGGKPALLSTGEKGDLAPEVADFLQRDRVQRVVQVGGRERIAAPGTLEHIEAQDASAAARALARRFFGKSPRVVACRRDDFASALCASALAARLQAPLLFSDATGFASDEAQVLEELGASSVLFVGDGARFTLGDGPKRSLERMKNSAEVARWMQRHGLEVGYLAVANPRDRGAGAARKLSLAAAALAAGRDGAVVTVDIAVDAGSATGTPAGNVEGEAVRRAAIEAVQHELAAARAAIGTAPELLCLVGMPDALPMPRVASKDGIDADPVSDVEYANLDGDPFVETAFGRFVAEDGASALLLAARSLAYEDLLDPLWSSRFAMAEWDNQYGELFANVGFEAAPRVELGAKIEPGSPWTRLAALVHAAHSSWVTMGSTYAADSRVLLAPCVVESAGCSTASLDQYAEQPSVAARLLRNGAVAFVGNVRRTIAQYELYRSEFWNAALAGQRLGEAHRRALNHLRVAALDHDEHESGPHLYEFHNAAFYGDPALVLHRPSQPRARAARAEASGNGVVVRAPATWWSSRVVAPEDWKRDPAMPITTWRGFGVGVVNTWDQAHSRNLEVSSFLAEFTTRKRVTRLAPLAPPPEPLGWGRRFWVDEHADGTRTVLFRVRLIDFDMDAGRVLNSVESLRFRVE
jgi:hypothetical protein